MEYETCLHSVSFLLVFEPLDETVIVENLELTGIPPYRRAEERAATLLMPLVETTGTLQRLAPSIHGFSQFTAVMQAA